MNKHIKEPGSAITHFIGMIMAIFAAFPLLIRASREPHPVYLISLAIFAVSMILLYAASTIYHTLDLSPQINTILKKLDHMMIFILIAGTYTPICLLVGIIIKAFWVFCPKWVSSLLYIGMGWTCVLAFGKIIGGLTHAEFGWLLAGGIIYTVGGIIYALKLPLFNKKHKNFGSHEIFHLFVMGGSICHFIFMYFYVA